MNLKTVLASGVLVGYLAGSAVAGPLGAGQEHEAPERVALMHTSTSQPDQVWKHFGSRWRTVPSALGDALAEGSAPRATTRDWTRCAVRYGQKRTVVVCPDGWTTKWRHEFR